MSQQETDLAVANRAVRRVYVDRSRHLDLQRCKRLRFLGYHAGSQQRGLAPVRKSIHLVLGGAVHAGLEVLLREGQAWLSSVQQKFPDNDLKTWLDWLFMEPESDTQHRPPAFRIEELAVEQALTDLTDSTAFGVETDDQERQTPEQQAAEEVAVQQQQQEKKSVDKAVAALTNLVEFPAPAPAIDASDLAKANLKSQLEASVALEAANQTSSLDWGQPVYLDEVRQAAVADDKLALLEQIEINHEAANQQRATGIDDYLKLELAALVEAMVRAYARRRLRPLLEQYEVLEVEREGEWKLGELAPTTLQFTADGSDIEPAPGVELWFMSRHDALLLERATGYLYLESFKTTGAWDRRRAADAEVDMQGLSEAVDVEKRFEEAWNLSQSLHTPNSIGDASAVAAKIGELVNPRTAQWLSSLPEPPKILGVRYEYLIKGSRRADSKDLTPAGYPRYVTDSPLIRAYKTDGITADDRRWAHSYNYWDIVGKKSTLNYRTWQKAPVWQYMTILRWIDMLDRGEVQPDSYDANGLALDALAEQFVPPIVVYRNEDDMRDMLQQLEAEESRVALDVAAVLALADDQAKLRSELNVRFAQNRKSCSYPGMCQFRPVCFGSSDMRRDPEASELYQVRVSNHKQEDGSSSHA